MRFCYKLCSWPGRQLRVPLGAGIVAALFLAVSPTASLAVSPAASPKKNQSNSVPKEGSGTFMECLPAPPVAARIVGLINAYTLKTAKGHLIKLAGVKPLEQSLTSYSRNIRLLVQRSQKLLAKLTLNKTVTLGFDDQTPDRYNRRAAHIFLASTRKKNATWVQGELVKKGMARVFPNTPRGACLSQLFNMEKDARQKPVGLWKHQIYHVVQAKNLKTLNSRLGQLHLIEGRVQSIAVRRTKSYINFSTKWRDDFTVTISRRVHRLFTQSGINIKEWAGKNVRVRGWLDRHNGPTIKLYHAAQIEVLND